MDGETIVALIIIIIGVIWNLFAKLREKTITSSPPWQDGEDAEIHVDDLEPFENADVIMQPAASYLVQKQDGRKAIAEGYGVREGMVKKETAGHEMKKCEKVSSLAGDYSLKHLRKAIIWSEILAPPLALRTNKDLEREW